MASVFEEALSKIDAAHAEDPKTIISDGKEVPYELHYAQKMSSYLERRAPRASDVLKLAIRGQHFRRWEVPRDSYPMTKIGYHTWRTHLKRRQAELVGAILNKAGYPSQDTERCMAMIKKEGLKEGDEETQVLEDVACLVFLDDQFEEFEEKHDAEKIVRILKKSWDKMSIKGQAMALEIPMTERCKELVGRALEG